MRVPSRVSGVWAVVLMVGVGLCALLTSVAGAVSLPDGRGYELVSPPQKGGTDVMASSMKTRIATDGDAVTFGSLGSFADAIGGGLESNYASVRTPDGWSTHSLIPVQEPQPWNTALSSVTPSYDLFSPDLSLGVLFSLSPLTEAPNAPDRNLYRRGDVLTAGVGSYDLLSDSSTPQTPPTPYRPRVAAASSDFGHILFESQLDLVPGVTPCPDPTQLASCSVKAYEWDHGAVRLAGVMPDGQPATCSDGQTCSGPGTGALTYGGNAAISADGSRVFFSTPVNTFGLATSDADLYMRTNHATTIKVNASERDTPDPSGPRGARFWGTTADSSKVFFTSDEQLTNTDGSGLYMYDASRPDSDLHNLTLLSEDHEPSDGNGSVRGVIGMSTDGHYVYFLANSQLLAGGPTDGAVGTISRIYVWHDGVTRYLGAVATNGIINDGPFAVGGGTFVAQEKTARVTSDGLHLVFTARDGTYLGGYDHGARLSKCGGVGLEPCSEVYLYDYDGDGGVGKLLCVSCVPSGASATADASTVSEVGRSNTVATSYLNHPLSDDGRYVFFTSGEALVASDDNGVRDAYEFDTQTGTLHLLSTGKNPSDSFFIDATPNGDNALIATRDQLVGVDTDKALDFYVVRVGGGIAAQNPSAVPGECDGESCHGAASAPPADPTPASVDFTGGSSPRQVGLLLGQLNTSVGVFNVGSLSRRDMRRLEAGKRARLRVTVSDPGRVHARLQMSVGGRVRIIGTAARTAARGGLVELTLKLSPAGQARLRRFGRIRVTVVVTYSKAFDAQRATFTLTQDGGQR